MLCRAACLLGSLSLALCMCMHNSLMATVSRTCMRHGYMAYAFYLLSSHCKIH